MALPMEEAKRIAREIMVEFKHWGWKAKVYGSENEVIIETRDEDHIGFAYKLRDFAAIAKGWSVTVRQLNGKMCIIIW